MRAFLLNYLLLVLAFGCLGILEGCDTLASKIAPGDPIQLPFIKNSPNECYYLDEFMPIPDELVTGKYGTLNTRYYTYHNASYKDLDRQNIILSFYSRNNTCWSLYEEYYMQD